jgi:hypothetical protein
MMKVVNIPSTKMMKKVCGSREATGGLGLKHQPVIASEAKQSISPGKKEWIASSLSLLAMTKCPGQARA